MGSVYASAIMNSSTRSDQGSSSVIQTALVHQNKPLCREHFELTLEIESFPPAVPGQFVHINPAADNPHHPRCAANAGEKRGAGDSGDSHRPPDRRQMQFCQPMLRRAFSIASLDRSGQKTRCSIIYRVVGRATRWLASLTTGSVASLLGPLGRPFPILDDRKHAWMIAGGVGLPPMLWLSEALGAAGKRSVAFYGAGTLALMAIELSDSKTYSADARSAALASDRFSRQGTSLVLATDDGSIGFKGHVGAALEAYHQANPISPEDLVIYTCGPEIMMRAVAGFCDRHGIRCYVCVERAMACGTGTCQSCVVKVHDPTAVDGWRYSLCCTDGPVFDATDIAWPRG